MKTPAVLSIAVLTLLAAFCVCGCATHAIPPGECAYWEHSGNYGPFQTHVVAHNVVKLPDGTFRVSDYTGSATWLTFGPHDTVQGLVINPSSSAIK